MSSKVGPHRPKHLLGRILLVIFLAFVVIELIMLPAPWTVARLRNHNPELTALMKERIRQARERHERYIIYRKYVPLSRISKTLVHAVIVGEDGTFYQNDGVDWYEVEQSIKADFKAMRFVRGSSTISMQLAKNLWFSTKKDILTKIDEMISAYMLNFYLSKYRIMELYLNYIEFGRGIFGAEAASEYYFHEPASALTRDQAAQLEAIVPDPLRFTPDSDSRFVAFRTAVILRRMEARGW
ncbi:MAG: monofunctional biosynthetic peptidoglycan transglycosylase [Bacteroidetes bacterium]|nr:monofunctional biosynthetic peptidoglycan transglycosylase [Bacteroidota bacterium]